ncbi:hypothetical protein J6590_025812 [Homalodisca vitripennis]|nr:hypothetical protein J6590_025812 [Homalodisca vitripennis]
MCSREGFQCLDRPGAKLLAVIGGRPPPLGSCCVLFAGTNDVAAGETHSILEHLERQITARLSSSVVILKIVLVNSFIEELCVRYEGVELMEFNSIGRRWFTNHGMHLARQEAAGRSCGGGSQSLHSVDCCTFPASAPDCSCYFCLLATSESTSPLSPALPRTLPHDSFGEAVKSGGKTMKGKLDHSPTSNKTVF